MAVKLRTISSALVDIFYPKKCQICEVDLNINEQHVCLSCRYDLPYIVQNKNELQQLQKIFWGRIQVEQVFSLLNYQKGNQVQQLLHQLKYNQKTRMGEYFGEVLGEAISKESAVDFILPVPLHPKKLKKRGYNQSSVIAKGIGRSLNVHVKERALIRNTFNLSQTRFSKYDRWNNVRNIFSVINPKQLENKHLLLVDDVLTTGATLEACAHELLQVKNCSVSIATLAARL